MSGGEAEPQPPRRRMRTFVGGAEVEPAAGWAFTWVDPLSGIGRLSDGRRSLLVVVEGGGTDWHVVLRGRRIPVIVRTWREELLAEAEQATGTPDGPLDLTATLPGMVVAVAAAEGSDVIEGDPLLTIEAMKMQNEVRAPRAGRVAAIAVGAGQTVTTGQLLLRLE